VITTLASRSYEYCVSTFEFDDEFELLCAVIRHMPRFIETQSVDGRQQWFTWNETTIGENFAEKWNTDARVVVFRLARARTRRHPAPRWRRWSRYADEFIERVVRRWSGQSSV
jgi:hypothetical protein